MAESQDVFAGFDHRTKRITIAMYREIRLGYASVATMTVDDAKRLNASLENAIIEAGNAHGETK